jgi:vancomycin resistance protein VanJ
LVAERNWIATLLTYLPQWPWAIPLPFLALGALWRKSPADLIACAASAAIVAFPLNSFNIPLRPPAARADLRVMTFNIHGGRQGVPRVASSIHAASPDVVCLQEALAEEGSPDPVPALRLALPSYTFARAGGIVIASRLPVKSIDTHSYSDGRIWRKALDVRVEANGCVIRVLAVHFVTGRLHLRGSTSSIWRDSGQTRIAQADDVLKWVRRTKLPTIVAGDFNTPPRGLAYARLRSGLHSAFQDAGMGFGWTYPASHPMLRIDHVFTANGVSTSNALVGPAGASDHRPLICDLAIRR